MTAQRPRQRKGFTLAAVWWHPDGSIKRLIYEPIQKARAIEAAPRPPARPRSALAIETGPQRDLFARD